MTASENTGRLGEAISPGSISRERTTASQGADSWASASSCLSKAAWASSARSCASTWAMSSLRGPASSSSSAFWVTSTLASATATAERALSTSSGLTARPEDDCERVIRRWYCRWAFSASATADWWFARAWAISSGRLPLCERSTTARWDAGCGSSRLVSTRASSCPAFTRSPSCTSTAAMRSRLLNGRSTCRRSTLPCSSSWAEAERSCDGHQA